MYLFIKVGSDQGSHRFGPQSLRIVPNRFAMSPIASHCPQSVASGSLRLLSECPSPFLLDSCAKKREFMEALM